MESVVGAIFPISPEHADRLFAEGRTVFVKYTRFTKLDRNSKIVFYLSKEKRLAGEGIIEKVEKVNPETVWAQYGKQIFINKAEFNKYVSNSPIDGRSRENEAITIFVLKNLRSYKKTNPLTQRVTPVGYYLTKSEYQRITDVK